MKTPMYEMTLKLLVENCNTTLFIKSGFDFLDLEIVSTHSGVVGIKMGLEINEVKYLIEMLQLVLVHSGVENETK